MATTPEQPGRLSGSLVHRYMVDIPADPGWSQPDRHRDDSAGGEVTRDQAPAGGGWQPDSWSAPSGGTLDGSPQSNPPSHKGTGHRGERGRGAGRPAEELDSLDRTITGDPPAPLWGAGGAAFGGLVLSGSSLPEANRPVARRRADGGTVINAGGLRIGARHIRVSDEHRQGLHFNRPTLRWIRTTRPVTEQDSPSPGGRTSPFNPTARLRTAGPVTPRSRRILRPYGQTDHVDVDAYPSGGGDAGVIGEGSWVQ